jgi:DNA-binding response OmpR family regulator
MLGKRIVIIDDENDALEFLTYNLEKEGFKIEAYSNPIIGLQAILLGQPDLVITDWIMPEIDGLELCRKMKQHSRTRNIPLVMITCKNDEIDIVTALEVGADEYIVKPFKVKELIARIKKLLGRNINLNFIYNEEFSNALEQNSHKININGLTIDKTRHEVYVKDKKLDLTFSEFKVLELLANKPGKVYTRNQILQYSFGQNYHVNERTVDVKIVTLRRKLGKHEDLVKTIRSVGYKLDLEKSPLETTVK